MFVTYAILLIIGVIVLVIAMAGGVALIVNVTSALWLAKRGAEAAGTVTRVDERKPGRAARVQVRYETPGGSFTIAGTSQRGWPGVPVAVRYNPARPAQATTLTRPWQRALTGIPVVLLTAATGGGMVTSAAWYYSGSRTPLQVPLAGGAVALGIALMCATHVSRRYTVLRHWRRMVQADGKVQRYADHSPVGAGILISFPSADGSEKFWVRAGTILAKVGDTVTVRYDPDMPAVTATVEAAGDLRSSVIATTVVGAGCLAFAIYLFSML